MLLLSLPVILFCLAQNTSVCRIGTIQALFAIVDTMYTVLIYAALVYRHTLTRLSLSKNEVVKK